MMQSARSSNIKALCRTCLLVILIGAANPVVANKSDGPATTETVADEISSRKIVLRSVRMPEKFSTYILALDNDARIIDRKQKVASMADADVWIVGLKDWSDTQWLSHSAVHRQLAEKLTAVAADVPFTSFQWNPGKGRTLDLYFVNLAHIETISEACLAQTLYRLSQVRFHARHAKDSPVAPVRAEPLASLYSDTSEQDLCS